jgi:hypothetical protein
LKYNTNDIEVFVNGISKGTDTSASPAACDRFGFDNRAIGQNPLFSNIKQTILFPTRLANYQLEDLTGDSYQSYIEMADTLNYYYD